MSSSSHMWKPCQNNTTPGQCQGFSHNRIARVETDKKATLVLQDGSLRGKEKPRYVVCGEVLNLLSQVGASCQPARHPEE